MSLQPTAEPRSSLVTRFNLDDILGPEVVDFRVLDSNFQILGNNAAHLSLDNPFTGNQYVEGNVTLTPDAGVPSTGELQFFDHNNSIRSTTAGGATLFAQSKVGINLGANFLTDGTTQSVPTAASPAMQLRVLPDQLAVTWLPAGQPAGNMANYLAIVPHAGPTNAAVSLLGTQAMVVVAAQTSSSLATNADFNGTNWNRILTTQPATQVIANNNGVYVQSAAAGANPIAWTSAILMHGGGGGTIQLAPSIGGPAVRTIGAWLLLEAAQAGVTLASSSTRQAYVVANAWSDGSNWLRYDVGVGAVRATWAYNTFTLESAPAGANPIGAWTPMISMTAGGLLTVANGQVITTGYLGFADGYGIYVGDTQARIVSAGRNWFFDQYAGAWYFRNTSTNAYKFIIDSAGNLTAYGTSLIVGATSFTNDGNSIYYNLGLNTGAHHFRYNNGTYGPCYALSFNPSSAARLKTNIRPIVDPLSLVLDDNLHGITYDDVYTGEHRWGFVADPWLARTPSMVSLDADGEVVALDYDRIGAITFEALKQYVTQTEARLTALERKAA